MHPKALNPQGKTLESTRTKENLKFIENKFLFSFYTMQAYFKAQKNIISQVKIFLNIS